MQLKIIIITSFTVPPQPSFTNITESVTTDSVIVNWSLDYNVNNKFM